MMKFLQYQLKMIPCKIWFVQNLLKLQRNYSSGFKVIHVSSNVRKIIVVEFDVEVLVKLILKTPFHMRVTTKSIPLDLGCDPPEPPRGVTVAYVQHVVPYYRPSRRPLNYLKYKKDFDLDVCVRVFKVAIKVNGETINEQITNLFNFMLKDNAFDQCNNYMRNHVDLQIQSKLYVDAAIGLCKMMNKCIYS